MKPERPKQREDEESSPTRRRPERADEQRRRRRSWIGDAEIARSLNAAVQDEEIDRND